MIMLKTPKFWYERSNAFLRCLGSVSSFIHDYYRNKPYFATPQIKTIAIGGITVGGSGKTPMAKYICSELEKRNHKPIICLRGYGRKSDVPILVDRNVHTYRDVGDEAMLLSKYANVVVSADRKHGHDIAVSSGADTLILDDGLEQRAIKPNVKILVIDGFQGQGNGVLFPFGPLRNTLENSLKNIDHVFFFNHDTHGLIPLIKKYIDPVLVTTELDFSGIPDSVIAFSGLGMNEKFFRSVTQYRNVVKTFGYPDHYPYMESDIINMSAYGYPLVTTEKDYQRIPASVKEKVMYIPLSIRCDYAEF